MTLWAHRWKLNKPQTGVNFSPSVGSQIESGSANLMKSICNSKLGRLPCNFGCWTDKVLNFCWTWTSICVDENEFTDRFPILPEWSPWLVASATSCKYTNSYVVSHNLAGRLVAKNHAVAVSFITIYLYLIELIEAWLLELTYLYLSLSLKHFHCCLHCYLLLLVKHFDLVIWLLCLDK
jgi:hypothetical protein